MMRASIIALIIFGMLWLPNGKSNASSLTRDSSAMLRVDVDLLARHGIIKTPVTSWPLYWPALMQDLRAVKPSQLDALVQSSYDRVFQRGKQALNGNSRNLFTITTSSGDTRRSQFGRLNAHSVRSSATHEGYSSGIDYRVRLSGQSDDANAALRGSYIGLRMENSILGFGRIDHWWGPSYAASLILGNNAPARPGFFFKTARAEPIDLPVVKWLGAWSFNGFAEILDDERHVDKAKLIGLSASFRPAPTWEISFRRTAQWGGEGRPENLSNFIDLISGAKDNCGEISCKADEPGNQLAAIDVEWHLPERWGSYYLQYIGEDEAGLFPSRGSYQIGVKGELDLADQPWQMFVELADTASSKSNFKERRYNTLYNHNIYKTGYRYHQASLGAPWDNDAQVLSVGLQANINSTEHVDIRMSGGKINRDSIDAAATKHSLTETGAEFVEFEARRTWQMNFGAIETGIAYLNYVDGQVPGEDEGMRLTLGFAKDF